MRVLWNRLHFLLFLSYVEYNFSFTNERIAFSSFIQVRAYKKVLHYCNLWYLYLYSITASVFKTIFCLYTPYFQLRNYNLEWNIQSLYSTFYTLMFTTAIKKTVLSYIKNVTALWTALHYKPAYSFLYCPPYSAGSTQLKEIALFELFCLTVTISAIPRCGIVRFPWRPMM